MHIYMISTRSRLHKGAY